MLRATVNETRRTFDLKSRTARAPYFAFLLCTTVLFVLSLAISVQVLPDEHVTVGLFAVTALFYLPVTTAGVRRLHDAGESGMLMLDPLKPLTALFVVLLLLSFAVRNSGDAGIIVFAGAFIFADIVFPLFCIALLLAVALTLMFFSNTMGLLLLPSQPGTNAYGPNPKEVTP